jgi:twitching motility protein PilT
MKLFKDIIAYSLKERASDIHLGVGYLPAVRIDGKICFVDKFPLLTAEDMKEVCAFIFGEREQARFETGYEVDFAFSYEGQARFRANVYRERQGINLALRYLPEIVPKLGSFDIISPFEDVMTKLAMQPHGLLLVTGPTGSGKSTTLAALIDIINEKLHEHIITIEDPIEYIYKSKLCLIKQREVGEGEDSPSFPHALRAALREDPDVILVGEMRDRETMSLAITAAETGHLVLSTVHTSNTYQAINRIVDVFPAEQQDQIRAQLSQNLIAVVAQRLIPKINGGRIAAFEILISNSAVKQQIRDNNIQMILNTIKTSRKQGMILLEDYLKLLIEKKLIEPAVAQRFLVNQTP